jgi:hypothetical protein
MGMSAAEIIEQIKTLPKSDLLEVYSFLREEVDATPETSSEVSDAEVDSALEKIFRVYGEDFKMLAK